MEFLVVVVVVLVLAGLIYTLILSSKAKKDRYVTVSLPPGRSVQNLIQQIAGDLPRGWSPVGAKKSHSSVLAQWAQEGSGGNLIDIATGGIVGTYVVSVELSVTSTDDFGRPVEREFDAVPPQSDYNAHMWVSYASAGQGKMWYPSTSTKILRAKDYLEERLTSVS